MEFDGSDEFNWVNVWKVHSIEDSFYEDISDKLTNLNLEALHLEKSESGSGLIYWNGCCFKWNQLGE